MINRRNCSSWMHLKKQQRYSLNLRVSLPIVITRFNVALEHASTT
jgi:hypothetical protein